MKIFNTLIGTLLLTSTALAETQFSYDRFIPQAKSIVAHMSVEEKVGQMLLPTYDVMVRTDAPNATEACKAAWPTTEDVVALGAICNFNTIAKYHLGAILTAGGPIPFSDMSHQGLPDWQKLTKMTQEYYHQDTKNPASVTTILLGTDAIHGNQHVTGTVLFPHNIGLGATHNPALIKTVTRLTTNDVLDSGFNWSFMPTIAIVKDYRWGRTYESFSENPVLMKAYARAYIEGAQEIEHGRITGTLSTAKHFIGDGETEYGQDEGYTYTESLQSIWASQGAGYEGAVEAHIGSVMVSYNSLNNIPMHFGGDYDILNKFRNVGIQGSDQKTYQLGGFVVSDYAAVSRAAFKEYLLDPTIDVDAMNQEQLQTYYVKSIARSVNAGVDMFMLGNGPYANPFNYTFDESTNTLTNHSLAYYTEISTVQQALLTAINNYNTNDKQDSISPEKLNDVVTRIIAVKLSMQSQAIKQNQDINARLSLKAAEQSLVLLKNDADLLPVKQNTVKNIVLIGDINDIGKQNGGWTINWQGQAGNEFWAQGSAMKASAHATSIEDGVKNILGDSVQYVNENAVILDALSKENTVAIVAIGEPPYAEYMGDVDNASRSILFEGRDIHTDWYTRGALGEENPAMSASQSDFLGITLTEKQAGLIAALRAKGIPVVTVLFSGRPVIITEGNARAPLQNSDAFIAAFLPGTSGGQAIANAIFGRYSFKSGTSVINGKNYNSNTLPFAWPKDMNDVRSHSYHLFPAEYGLATE